MSCAYYDDTKHYIMGRRTLAELESALYLTEKPLGFKVHSLVEMIKEDDSLI